MPLVLLHGIAQETHTAGNVLHLWSDSLAAGLDRARLTLRLDEVHKVAPCYGRLLAGWNEDGAALVARTLPRAAAKPDVDDLLRGGAESPSIGASIEREIVAELSRRSGRRITPADEDDLQRSAATSMLGVLGSLLPDAAQVKLVDQVFAQVEAYLAVPATREEIQSRARAALKEADGARKERDSRLVVVGHSLGSVVALEAIWEWTGGPVDLLVTVGSPLCIGGVHSRLAKFPPGWPVRLHRWVNAADRDDVVALYGAVDRTNLFARMAEADLSARADVLNVLDVRNHMGNHHGIAGYLDDPVVARLIYEGLAVG